MSKTHLLKATLFLGLGLMLWPGFGCAKPTGPELRSDQFFPIELSDGDQLVYGSPSGTVVIDGPATTMWEWKNGELFIESDSGKARVRPLMEAPPEKMTEQMIVSARSIFVDVPYIEVFLAETSNPTNREWGIAYTSWLDACREFSTIIKTKLKNDSREAETVVEEIADWANEHALVVPGTVEIIEAPEGGDFFASLLLAYKGMPLNDDGSFDKVILNLDRNWQEPSALPNEISKEEALIFHHGINTFFESSQGPLFIDISTGISISTKNGRE